MTRPTDEIDSRIDIERRLAALSPQQVRAVRLYEMGYTYAEIAVRFGVSVSTICMSFQRIREKVENK